MTIKNYSTGATIGTSTSIDAEKYEAYLAADNTGTGAVKAGDWISSEELAELGIASSAASRRPRLPHWSVSLAAASTTARLDIRDTPSPPKRGLPFARFRRPKRDDRAKARTQSTATHTPIKCHDHD